MQIDNVRATQWCREAANSLRLRVTIIDNEAQRKYEATALGAVMDALFMMRITVVNAGDSDVPADGWELRIPSIRRLLHSCDPRFEVKHLVGDQHVLKPVAFEGLPAGEMTTIDLVGEACVVQQSDILPRWGIWAPPAEVVILKATDTDDVRDFVDPIAADLVRLGSADHNRFASAQWRFERNAEIPNRDPKPLIPTPLRWVRGSGTLDLSAGLQFCAVPAEVLPGMLDFWISTLGAMGIGWASKDAVPVQMTLDVTMLDEQYHLSIAQDSISVVGGSARALNWAMMSLRGLLPSPGSPLEVPIVQIDDAPRFPWRSFMIDIGRNGRSPDFLRRLIDQLAAYKYNVLHLHLTEDEAWRLEIPGLPELTQVGSRRGHGGDETQFLSAQLGTGIQGGESGVGYLSCADYIDLLRYAHARGVEVVPEINVPGHSRAAVMAMEARYRRTGDTTYRLIDPDDSTRLLTNQFYDRHALINPAVPGALRFVEHVVKEVVAMHETAGIPLRYWHCGGDEVHNILLDEHYDKAELIADPDPRVVSKHAPWQGSPIARAKAVELALPSVAALSGWFLAEIAEILAAHGISTLHVWQDGVTALSDGSGVALPVVAEVWAPVDMGAEALIADLQSRGFQAIACAPDFTYFDTPYEVNPREPGTTWATRRLDERVAFSYVPDNPSQVATWHVSRMGEAMSVTSPAGLGPVKGVQAHLWTETTRTAEQAWYLMFPRAIATAERAWHHADWELPRVAGRVFSYDPTGENAAAMRADFGSFAKALATRELAKLDAVGVTYRVPPPGVQMRDDGFVDCNVALDGLPIEVSVDGGTTWSVFEGPMRVNGSIAARVRSADGRRTSFRENSDRGL